MKRILILFSLSVFLCSFGLFLASCDKPYKIDKTQIPISPRRPRIADIQNVLTLKLQEDYQIVEQQFIDIISLHLGVPHEEITRKTHLASDLDANELEVMEIIMDLEEQFDLWLPKDARDSITQVGNGIEYLRDRIEKQIHDAKQFHNELLSLAQSGQAFSGRDRDVRKYGESQDIGRFLYLGIWTTDESTSTLADISTAFYQSPSFWPILVWTNSPDQRWAWKRPEFAYLSEESTPETRLETGKRLRVLYLRGD